MHGRKNQTPFQLPKRPNKCLNLRIRVIPGLLFIHPISNIPDINSSSQKQYTHVSDSQHEVRGLNPALRGDLLSYRWGTKASTRPSALDCHVQWLTITGSWHATWSLSSSSKNTSHEKIKIRLFEKILSLTTLSSSLQLFPTFAMLRWQYMHHSTSHYKTRNL